MYPRFLMNQSVCPSVTLVFSHLDSNNRNKKIDELIKLILKLNIILNNFKVFPMQCY